MNAPRSSDADELRSLGVTDAHNKVTDNMALWLELVLFRNSCSSTPVGLIQWSIQDFWIGGGGGPPVGMEGMRQVRWHSRLWTEIKKIGLACPK